MAFVKLESEYPSHQISRYNERQQRFLRNLMGKLIDTRTSAIYNVEGQKQHSIATVPSSKFVEDLACLEACYTCVEEFPVIPHKRKAPHHCGPLCDCANSCSRVPIEQVDKLYGQSESTRGDKTCFWKTYLQSLNNALSQ